MYIAPFAIVEHIFSIVFVCKKECRSLFFVPRPSPPPPPKIQGNFRHIFASPPRRISGGGEIHHSTHHRRLSQILQFPPSFIFFPWWSFRPPLAVRALLHLHGSGVMGKFLKCADCGKIFRGKRRRPCSQHILTILRRKNSECTASASDFVHENCFLSLRKRFGTLGEGEQQVSTFHFLF